ncbi:MAG: hypothetical protein AAFX01_02790 [Cyanobacteria bacterium J06638_28]
MNQIEKNFLNIELPLGRWLRAGCFVGLSTAALVACSSPQTDDVTPSQDESINPASQAKLEQLENQRMVIYGDFQEELGGALFVIEEDSQRELEDILILNQSGRSFSVPEGADVAILAIGEVKPLDLTQLEAEDQETLAAYDGELVLHADRVTLAPDPKELVENAAAFYDEDVSVYGEVEQVNADNTFILKDPDLFEGKGIVVIQSGEATAMTPANGDAIAVTGILRPYVIAELEEAYGLTWDLSIQEQLEADYQSIPVLIADYISED